MKYAIVFKPTNEYVEVYKDNKPVLFLDTEEDAISSLYELLYMDGGYDGDIKDFSIESVISDTDGSEYIKDNDTIFYPKNIIK